MKNFLMTQNIRNFSTSSFVALMTQKSNNRYNFIFAHNFEKTVFVFLRQSTDSYFSLRVLAKNVQPTPKRLSEMTLTPAVVSVVKLSAPANDLPISLFGSRQYFAIQIDTGKFLVL